MSIGQAYNAAKFRRAPTRSVRGIRCRILKFTNLGGDVQQRPGYQFAKFRPFLTLCLPDRPYLLSIFVDFVESVTDKNIKRHYLRSAYHAATIRLR